MKFKLATLTQAQINKLPKKIKEEVIFVKDNTDNFDELFFEVFEDNDKRLFDLAKGELAEKKEETMPAPSKPKSDKPKVEKPVAKSDNKPPKPEEVKVEKKKVQPTDVIKSIEKKAKEIKKDKPAAKAPESVKKPALSKATEAKKEALADFSWRRKVDSELLESSQKVTVNCEFFAVTAEKDMKVEIKQTFNKGDTLLVHADGYPFAVMKADAFKKRSSKVVNKVELKPEKPEPTIEAKKKKQVPKHEPKAKKPDDKCNLDNVTGDAPVPFLTWLDGQVELWKNRETNQKVSKVMAVKSTGEIIIEFTHYDKLLRVADLRLSYYRICLETTKLTKAKAPARGSYRLLVSKNELKEDYSTKRNWNSCRIWIKEAYRCAREGNCSEDQKGLFKKFYHECGDKVAKSEDVQYLRWLHKKAGEEWNRGEESYFEAFRRITKSLKKSNVKKKSHH